MRGGEFYYRPRNWKRFGLNILGKYENDFWVGIRGDGVWAVAYHGTNFSSLPSIISKGLLIGGKGD